MLLPGGQGRLVEQVRDDLLVAVQRGARCSEKDDGDPHRRSVPVRRRPRSGGRRAWQRVAPSRKIVTRAEFVGTHSNRMWRNYLRMATERVVTCMTSESLHDVTPQSLTRLFVSTGVVNAVVRATNSALAAKNLPLTSAQEVVRFCQTTLAFQLTRITKATFFESERFCAQHFVSPKRFDELRSTLQPFDTGSAQGGVWHDVSDLTLGMHKLEEEVAFTNITCMLGTYNGEIALTIDDDLHRCVHPGGGRFALQCNDLFLLCTTAGQGAKSALFSARFRARGSGTWPTGWRLPHCRASSLSGACGAPCRRTAVHGILVRICQAWLSPWLTSSRASYTQVSPPGREKQ